MMTWSIALRLCRVVLGIMLLLVTLLAAEGVAQTAPGNAVLLELFTSQGCSSCPPADRLLTDLADSPELRGKIVPLAFHVDYWNYIGWRDPFSDKQWSERQQHYSEAFKSSRIYTPQMVVNGSMEFVGSDRKRARREIAAALEAPPLATIEIELARDEERADLIVAHIRVSLLRPVSVKELDVMVAAFESRLETTVTRGENARKTLHNNFVVRLLTKIHTLAPATTDSWEGEIPVKALQGWKEPHLGIAVFLQDPDTRKVYAAAQHRLEVAVQ